MWIRLKNTGTYFHKECNKNNSKLDPQKKLISLSVAQFRAPFTPKQLKVSLTLKKNFSGRILKGTHWHFIQKSFLSILMTTPIFPHYQNGLAKASKNYKALQHVPRSNVLKFQWDWISFTQVNINKWKLIDAKMQKTTTTTTTGWQYYVTQNLFSNCIKIKLVRDNTDVFMKILLTIC